AGRPGGGGGGLLPAEGRGGASQPLFELAVDGCVSRREFLAVGEKVLPPQLHGIAAEPLGGDVEQGLERPGELGYAEAAKRAAGGGVRVDGARVEGDRRDPVRACRRVRRLLDDARADVRVAAHVIIRVALD